MGGAKINTVSRRNNSGVRVDALKALVITLSLHVALITLLGLVVAHQVKNQTVLLVARAGGDADPEIETPERRPVVSKPVGGAAGFVTVDMEPEFSFAGMAPKIQPITEIKVEDFTIPEGFYDFTSQDGGAITPGPTGEVSQSGEKQLQGWTGIQIAMDHHFRLPRITRVISGGPAHRDGALGGGNLGDYIISVDGEPTGNRALAEIRDLIVGQAGSVVSLGICRYPGSAVTVVSIRRGLLH